MLQYVRRRLLISVPLLLALTLVTFVLATLMPGDVVDYLLDPTAQVGETAIAAREALGLDKPVLVRYVIWLRELLQGNLGFSFVNRQPVAQRISERLGPTLLLMGSASALGLLVGIPLGIFLAVKQYSAADYALTTLALATISVPSFFLGLGAIYIFALKLNLLPVAGMATLGASFSLRDRLVHLLLPVLVLGGPQVAQYTRYMRSSMLEVISEQYVLTARSKGLAEVRVLFKHASRNALLPIITVLGLSLPTLFGGAVITEQIFRWPGIGMLTIQALMARDYPVLMGINLISAVLVFVGSLLADVGYALADPRVRYD